jgi:predicted secreted hydrolase
MTPAPVFECTYLPPALARELPIQFPADTNPHPKSNIENWSWLGSLRQTGDETRTLDVALFFTKVDSWCDGNPATAYYQNNLLLHDFVGGHPDSHQPPLTTFSNQYSPFGPTVLQSNGSSPLFHLSVETPATLLVPATWRAPEWSVTQLRADNGTAPAAYALHAATTSGTKLDLILTQLYPDRMCGTDAAWAVGATAATSTYLVAKPQLRARGTATLGDSVAITVEGDMYLSHFFTTEISGVAAPPWNWFYVNLDNGWAFDVTLYLGNSTNDVTVGSSYMRVMGRDQSSHLLLYPEFSVHATEPWESPATGVRYYGRHVFDITAFDLVLEVWVHTPDNELNAPPSSPFVSLYEGIGSARAWFAGGRRADGTSSTEYHGALVFAGR